MLNVGVLSVESSRGESVVSYATKTMHEGLYDQGDMVWLGRFLDVQCSRFFVG